MVKILHILNDGPADLPEKIIAVQNELHHVKVVDLTQKDLSYDALIDDIFSYDRVISW